MQYFFCLCVFFVFNLSFAMHEVIPGSGENADTANIDMGIEQESDSDDSEQDPYKIDVLGPITVATFKEAVGRAISRQHNIPQGTINIRIVINGREREDEFIIDEPWTVHVIWSSRSIKLV